MQQFDFIRPHVEAAINMFRKGATYFRALFERVLHSGALCSPSFVYVALTTLAVVLILVSFALRGYVYQHRPAANSHPTTPFSGTPMSEAEKDQIRDELSKPPAPPSPEGIASALSEDNRQARYPAPTHRPLPADQANQRTVPLERYRYATLGRYIVDDTAIVATFYVYNRLIQSNIYVGKKDLTPASASKMLQEIAGLSQGKTPQTTALSWDFYVIPMCVIDQKELQDACAKSQRNNDGRYIVQLPIHLLTDEIRNAAVDALKNKFPDIKDTFSSERVFLCDIENLGLCIESEQFRVPALTNAATKPTFINPHISVKEETYNALKSGSADIIVFFDLLGIYPTIDEVSLVLAAMATNDIAQWITKTESGITIKETSEETGFNIGIPNMFSFGSGGQTSTWSVDKIFVDQEELHSIIMNVLFSIDFRYLLDVGFSESRERQQRLDQMVERLDKYFIIDRFFEPVEKQVRTMEELSTFLKEHERPDLINKYSSQRRETGSEQIEATEPRSGVSVKSSESTTLEAGKSIEGSLHFPLNIKLYRLENARVVGRFKERVSIVEYRLARQRTTAGVALVTNCEDAKIEDIEFHWGNIRFGGYSPTEEPLPAGAREGRFKVDAPEHEILLSSRPVIKDFCYNVEAEIAWEGGAPVLTFGFTARTHGSGRGPSLTAKIDKVPGIPGRVLGKSGRPSKSGEWRLVGFYGDDGQLHDVLTFTSGEFYPGEHYHSGNIDCVVRTGFNWLDRGVEADWFNEDYKTKKPDLVKKLQPMFGQFEFQIARVGVWESHEQVLGLCEGRIKERYITVKYTYPCIKRVARQSREGDFREMYLSVAPRVVARVEVEPRRYSAKPCVRVEKAWTVYREEWVNQKSN